jgi:hypothetical protein
VQGSVVQAERPPRQGPRLGREVVGERSGRGRVLVKYLGPPVAVVRDMCGGRQLEGRFKMSA